MGTRGMSASRAVGLAIAIFSMAVVFNNCSPYKFSQGTPGNNGTLGNGIPDTTPINFTMTNCTIGYPYSSANPATNITFNEAGVLAAFTPGGVTTGAAGHYISLWYSDEHAMTLGVRQVNTITASGTTSTPFAIAALGGNPGTQVNPQLGAGVADGGTDVSRCAGATTAQDACSRPMFPALFVTDITSNANATEGDWQFGGTAHGPSAIFGTWKAAVKTIDMTVSPPAVSIKVDNDPSPNNWNLGPGVPVPSSVPSGTETGFGAMVSWDVGNLGLQSGHTYRIQFMVHDGDQNRSGGDVGENCVNLQVQ